MKRIFIASILAFLFMSASAQESSSPTVNSVEQAVSIPKTDWLVAFNTVKIDGPMNVVFKKVEKVEELRITYDTKGNITSKFKFEIDRNGVLVVSEKSDPKRTSVTDITIYYNSLREVRVAHAKAEFEDEIVTEIFDLSVSGGAMASLNIKTLDTAVECTGVSRLTIGGETKYLTMRASTAKVDGSKLITVSSTVEASHSAEVRLLVSERLEATTSTGAKLLYKGYPVILREHNAIFGGEIININ